MKNNYSNKNINDWKKFKSFADKLSNDWIFRGQSNSSWDLKTSLERTDFFNIHEFVESYFLIDFQRGAKNYLSKEEMPDNLMEWLALMQHHGAPTRLLDFTKSPYIAAYFAFETAENNDKSVAIWAVNEGRLYNLLIKYLDFRHSEEYEKIRSNYSDEDYIKTKRQFSDKDFAEIFFRNLQGCIIPIEPFKMNRRYSLQQSIFLSTGNSIEPFMYQLDFLNDELNKVFIKICLPTSLKKEVLRDLQKMNINRTSLFPDLDGYSVGLKLKYNIQPTWEENLENEFKLFEDREVKDYL